MTLAPGTRVRARLGDPDHHTRLPAYVRGQTGEVVEAENFTDRSREWLHPHDHNHLRITRILKCLTRCGLRDEAAAFLRRLEAIADSRRVTPESLRYWREAVGPA